MAWPLFACVGVLVAPRLERRWCRRLRENKNLSSKRNANACQYVSDGFKGLAKSGLHFTLGDQPGWNGRLFRQADHHPAARRCASRRIHLVPEREWVVEGFFFLQVPGERDRDSARH